MQLHFFPTPCTYNITQLQLQAITVRPVTFSTIFQLQLLAEMYLITIAIDPCLL